MPRLTYLLCVFLLTAALTGVPASATPAQAAQGAPLDGRTLFADKGCAHCHGPEAAGGEDIPSLQGVSKRLTPEAMRHQILEGGKSMPAFGDALSAEETDSLIAWLRSLKPPPKNSRAREKRKGQ